MEGDDTFEAPSRRARLKFPPELSAVLCGLLPEHPVPLVLGKAALAEVLTAIFFASLQTEEHEHHPIRVALTAPRPEAARAPSMQGWKQLAFRRPRPCTPRDLLRLARAASAERLFVTLAGSVGEGLTMTGLAREGFGPDDGTVIKVLAAEPGCLEVWAAGRRVLEYVHGIIQAAPEDVLLSSGRVHTQLLAFAQAAQAPAGYIESIASIIRHLADHPHGGIVVLSPDEEPEMPPKAGFALEPDTHLWDALRELSASMQDGALATSLSAELMRGALRAEIERTLGEVGCMTALDGATILNRRLAVCGFGVVLPVHANVTVSEVMDASGNVRRPFALEQYGARHRAAASYAALHPGSVVFIASTTGDIGCMLRDEHTPSVMLWRFRSADLAPAS